MRLALVLAASALALCLPGAGASAPRNLSAFSGTGSWVSVYDTHALRHPAEVVATLRAHRVHTLFVETSNDREPRDVAHAAAVSQLIDDAHLAHIAVVGWYLPSLASPRRDIVRALAGARFTTPDGEHFDGFALDVEATDVRDLARRSLRAVWVTHDVRAALPRQMALGAITIDPTGAHWWRDYPFAGLARDVDVFLPMEYFTFRTHGARGVAAYSRANESLVRERAGDPSFPVHAVGGDARTATLPELRAFLRASKGSVGMSLWEYGETSLAEWNVLGAARA